ncbi:rod shape-determining protein MreD [Litorilinea aerophila]|uniref:Rod shape-determining protein MreD n=1 Tax=Litorilinea aerophila TaxID=1204385 RepID=A0A540VAM2_9CHLR|nr:rod shape-determining protein MreD [Litorilinea aerophila]MCC9078306.1 rod shape-determining protein MreD [Litorilinea aerophila]GIV77149.1 MAG: hypothetical protein KatS3mg050_1543 [Litorilinea sp.]
MNRGALYYLMIPLLVVAGLFQSSAAPHISIRGIKPDLVLLVVLVGTLLYGHRPGITWAFIGGIILDLFSGGPMGSSSLSLMLAALVAGMGHRTLSRFNLFVPLGACLLGTLVYATAYLSILGLLRSFNLANYYLPFWTTLQHVVAPAMLYNATLMLLLLPFLNRVPESQDL